jgi:hypothetical protein
MIQRGIARDLRQRARDLERFEGVPGLRGLADAMVPVTIVLLSGRLLRFRTANARFFRGLSVNRTRGTTAGRDDDQEGHQDSQNGAESVQSEVRQATQDFDPTGIVGDQALKWVRLREKTARSSGEDVETSPCGSHSHVLFYRSCGASFSG